MNTRNQRDCLPAEVILYLGECISMDYHLPRIDAERFQRAYGDPEGEGPYVLRSENGFLWLDRYYLAYTSTDVKVHYVYITRYHIEEEAEALKEAGPRNKCFTMNAEFQGYFRMPYDFMRRYGTDIWVSPEYAEYPAA